MEIGTEYGNFDTSVSRACGWNETMNLGELERGDRWRRVEIEENSRLRLALLYSGHSLGNLRGG